jgi:molybdopterin molybdotransferase
MLSVTEAQTLVLRQVSPLPPETVALHEALGLVLAEEIASDIDMPPYDKSLMDGYAVRSADLAEGHGTLSVIEEVPAGQTPRISLASGQATRIMTGAPIPIGADAVIMVERTRPLEGNRIGIEDRSPKPGQNILSKGREMKRGETVLKASTPLRPQELGVLATVGRASIRAYPAPRIAVLSTGDEVVDPPQQPGPGQIRNGNGPMLMAQVRRAGGSPRYLGIARDRLESLRPLVSDGLQADVLVLSGGVSAGQRDLVPAILQELGVQAHFHKVEMKPGKPVFFGTRKVSAVRGAPDPAPDTTEGLPEVMGDLRSCHGAGSGDSRPARRVLVFGLPGNPVSALVCFELFVRPAIRRLGGHGDPGPTMVEAVLTEDFTYRTDRPTYYPGWLETANTGWRIRPVPWFGSPDLRALTQSNAFLFVPSGDHQLKPGQTLPVLKTED